MSSSAPTSYRADHLVDRARLAYQKAGGREQPSQASDVHDINGTTAVILRNVNGLLAVYRVHGARLVRMSAGDAKAAEVFAQEGGVA